MKAGNEAISFSSWAGKICSVIAMVFVVVYAWDFFGSTARKGIFIVSFLMFMNQVLLAITLDFAGFAFHVFEESMEVVAALYLLVGVAMQPMAAEE